MAEGQERGGNTGTEELSADQLVERSRAQAAESRRIQEEADKKGSADADDYVKLIAERKPISERLAQTKREMQPYEEAAAKQPLSRGDQEIYDDLKKHAEEDQRLLDMANQKIAAAEGETKTMGYVERKAHDEHYGVDGKTGLNETWKRSELVIKQVTDEFKQMEEDLPHQLELLEANILDANLEADIRKLRDEIAKKRNARFHQERNEREAQNLEVELKDKIEEVDKIRKAIWDFRDTFRNFYDQQRYGSNREKPSLDRAQIATWETQTGNKNRAEFLEKQKTELLEKMKQRLEEVSRDCDRLIDMVDTTYPDTRDKFY